jgi:transcriptional regulator with XRE-family HTH domain
MVSDRDYDRILAQEELVLDATERVCGAMKDANVSRADLADRLGTTRGYVSQLLDGSRNMTLRTLSDLAFSLGMRFSVQLTPRTQAAPAYGVSQAWALVSGTWRIPGFVGAPAAAGQIGSPVLVSGPETTMVLRQHPETAYNLTNWRRPLVQHAPVSSLQDAA